MLVVVTAVFVLPVIVLAEDDYSFLTPQKVIETMWGSATKDNTPLQNELLWKNQCRLKIMEGEGVVNGIGKFDIGNGGLSDLIAVLGPGQKWIMSIHLNESNPFFKASVILDERWLDLAANLKKGDKIKFRCVLWLMLKNDTEMVVYTFAGRVLWDTTRSKEGYR